MAVIYKGFIQCEHVGYDCAKNCAGNPQTKSHTIVLRHCQEVVCDIHTCCPECLCNALNPVCWEKPNIT